MKKLCCLLTALMLLLTASVAFARTESEVETLKLVASLMESAANAEAESGSVACAYDEENDAFIAVMGIDELTTEELKEVYHMDDGTKEVLVSIMKGVYDTLKDALAELEFADVDVMVFVCGSDGEVAMAYSMGIDVTDLI